MGISNLFLTRVSFIYFNTLKAQRALHEKGSRREKERGNIIQSRREVVCEDYKVAGKSITNKFYLALRVI